MSTQRTRISPGGSVLRQPKWLGDYQATDCCVNPKDQKITRRVIVVWTLRTKRSPGGWLLWVPKGPGDHQAGDCCVNPKDQEITRQLIVVWTQRTRRLPGGWLLCEPKGPDHQAGDCCVNPKDQEITRRVTYKCFTWCLLLFKTYFLIVFHSYHVTYYYLYCLLFNIVCFEINWIDLLQNHCLWTWLQSAHNLSFLLSDHYRKVVKEMFPGSETAKKFSDVGQFEVLTVWRSTI